MTKNRKESLCRSCSNTCGTEPSVTGGWQPPPCVVALAGSCCCRRSLLCDKGKVGLSSLSSSTRCTVCCAVHRGGMGGYALLPGSDGLRVMCAFVAWRGVLVARTHGPTGPRALSMCGVACGVCGVLEFLSAWRACAQVCPSERLQRRAAQVAGPSASGLTTPRGLCCPLPRFCRLLRVCVCPCVRVCLCVFLYLGPCACLLCSMNTRAMLLCVCVVSPQFLTCECMSACRVCACVPRAPGPQFMTCVNA